MDRITKKQRSALMAKVRVRDTDIEKILGQIIRPLWKVERYKRNVRNLPGKPDFVFPKSKLAIFADGDFWHGKDFKRWKAGIPAFWRKKITSNIKRDLTQKRELKKLGFRVLRFYGSKIKNKQESIRNTIKNRIN